MDVISTTHILIKKGQIPNVPLVDILVPAVKHLEALKGLLLIGMEMEMEMEMEWKLFTHVV